MAQVAHNPQTGEYLIKEYGGDWQPATEEQARAASATGLTGFGQKVGASAILGGVDTAAAAAQGIDELGDMGFRPGPLGVTFDPLSILANLATGAAGEGRGDAPGPAGILGREVQALVGPDLEALRERDPAAFWTGQLAGLFPAVPSLARGAVGLAGQTAKGIAGQLPVAVKNVAQDMAGSVQAMIETGFKRVRSAAEGDAAFTARMLGREADEVATGAPRAAGADVTTNPTGAAKGEVRFLPGVMNAADARKARIPTTQAMDNLLNSTQATYDEAFEALQGENLASGAGYLGEYDEYQRVVAAQDRRFVERIGEELGSGRTRNSLTDNALVLARENNSAEFNEVFKGADLAQAPWQQVQRQFQDMMANAGAGAERSLQSIAKDVADLTEKAGSPKFANIFTGIRNKIERGLSAARAAGNSEGLDALTSLRDKIDDVAAKALGPGKQEQLQRARTRWRLLHVLGRTGTRDAHGMINPRTFANQYRQVFPEKRTFRRGANEFEEFMDTISALQMSRVGDSGTAKRVAGMGLLGMLGKTAAGGAAAGLGFNLLN